MKRHVPSALWLALVVQAAWVVLNASVLHRSPTVDAMGVTILVTFTVFAAVHRRWRSLGVVVRLLVAAAFLLAVADRVGLLGSTGAPGVAWGDWAHFVDYTRDVAGFLPGDYADALAGLATVAEVVLAAALLLGVRLPLAALASALLLGIYGTAMTVSLPAAEQFRYGVFVLAAGMLVLATLDEPILTLDRRFGARADAASVHRGARVAASGNEAVRR